MEVSSWPHRAIFAAAQQLRRFLFARTAMCRPVLILAAVAMPGRGALALWLGQDASFDQLNDHFYGPWALLHGRRRRAHGGRRSVVPHPVAAHRQSDVSLSQPDLIPFIRAAGFYTDRESLNHGLYCIGADRIRRHAGGRAKRDDRLAAPCLFLLGSHRACPVSLF
jgi:hypothetical protein